MKFLAKLKLLLKIQKPAGQLVDQLKGAGDEKRGWRTIGFWVTLAGTLTSTTLALSGVIPPQVQLIASSILQAAYNILRGAQNAETPTIKGTVRTTEFWLSTLTELQKALVAVHDGGVSAAWMQTATAIVGTGLALGQNLSPRNVNSDVQTKAATPAK